MQLNQQVRKIFEVTDLFGAAVTGLVTGNFTLTLTRESGAVLVAATETVTVTEIASGQYFVDYTPTADIGVYYLTVTHATNIVSPSTFQDDIGSGFASSTGTYLTTRENVRKALDIKDGDGSYTATVDDDVRIDMLLVAVTDFVQTFCRRIFFSATYTENPLVKGATATVIDLDVWPVTSITSVHVSRDLPRVYGADELLVNGTDYIVIESPGMLYRVDGGTWPMGPKTIQVIYVSGYATIPGDLEWAVIETIGYSLMRAKGKLLHLTGESHQEGSLAGVRFDIPDTSMRVYRMYKYEAA